MAFDNPPGWLQNAGTTHTAEQMRTYIGALINGLGAAGVVTRTLGAINPVLGTAMAVTQNGTPNMSVNVGAGVGFIEGTESPNQGMYGIRAGTVTNLTIATAPGAGLSRLDKIVAKVEDSAYSGSNNQWSLAVVTGTPAASPSQPASPNNSLTLAVVQVNANVTSILTANIFDTRKFLAAAGGNTPCLSTSRPFTLYDGLGIFEYDTNLFSWSDGTNWFPQSQWVQGQNIWIEPTTSNNFTSASYVNLTLNGVAQTISITKRYASTRLIVRFACTAVLPNATIILGASINGTDFDVRKGFNNSGTATDHLDFGGERWISGLAAGATTVTARIKTSAGTFTMDTGDTFSMTVEEVQ